MRVESKAPLAARMRPVRLEDFVGQNHLLGEGRPLRLSFEGHLHSFVLWGPPGTGKTTLAQLFAQKAEAQFLSLSAISAGVKDLREALNLARHAQSKGQPSILFIDEVHRFNKGQQDALLAGIEEGLVTLIGATTENPSFEINKALLSRTRVYTLQALTPEQIQTVMRRALTEPKFEMNDISIRSSDLEALSDAAQGDLRRGLNLLELLVAQLRAAGRTSSDDLILASVLSDRQPGKFDKGGDIFYEQISALHKSVRGSNPDAALYWLARMLDGGADPHYIARRLTRIAIEDISLADPRASSICLEAWEIYQRLGSPEGELALAQAVVYMSVAAKSNAVYSAFNAAQKEVQQGQDWPVPLHLRNASSALMRSLNYGQDYRYDHDEPQASARGQKYFPTELGERLYYHPSQRGLEAKIAERLAQWRERV